MVLAKLVTCYKELKTEAMEVIPVTTNSAFNSMHNYLIPYTDFIDITLCASHGSVTIELYQNCLAEAN